MVVLDSGDLSGAPGTVASPRLLYYLDYVFSYQVQVEYPPVGRSLCSLVNKVGTSLSLFLLLLLLLLQFYCWLILSRVLPVSIPHILGFDFTELD
jgi:hypothetical protein